MHISVSRIPGTILVYKAVFARIIQTNTHSSTLPKPHCGSHCAPRRSDRAPEDIRLSFVIFSIDHLLCPALSGSRYWLVYSDSFCSKWASVRSWALWVVLKLVLDSEGARALTRPNARTMTSARRQKAQHKPEEEPGLALVDISQAFCSSQDFSCVFPVVARNLGLNEVTGDGVYSFSDSHQILEPTFVPNMDSSHRVANFLVTFVLSAFSLADGKYANDD